MISLLTLFQVVTSQSYQLYRQTQDQPFTQVGQVTINRKRGDLKMNLNEAIAAPGKSVMLKLVASEDPKNFVITTTQAQGNGSQSLVIHVAEGRLLGVFYERGEKVGVEVMELRMAHQQMLTRQWAEKKPEGQVEEQKGWFERYKWYIVGFLLLTFVQNAMNNQAAPAAAS